jgi:hypothetical protein
MKPELEQLLKLLDAYLEGDPAQADDRFNLYEAKLQEHSAAVGISTATLDAAVRKKYPRWARANARRTTLPPKA